MQRFEKAWIRLSLGCKQRMEQLKRNENGMATVEMVILIVVAVIVVALVLELLTKNGFRDAETDETVGLIKYLFSLIRVKLSGTLG